MALAVPRSELGNQLATMRALAGKLGHSAKPNARAQHEQADHHRQKGQVRHESLQAGEDRPQGDGPEIDRARAIAVEQAAAGNLADDIGPAESREDIAQLDIGGDEISLDSGTAAMDRVARLA